MPGKLKVKIVAAQDLPVMDRASELTDAFVEVTFRCFCRSSFSGPRGRYSCTWKLVVMMVLNCSSANLKH